MKNLLLLAWATLPVAATAYHFGPGQEHLRTDEAARLLDDARAHAERAAEFGEDDPDARAAWTLAEAAYEDALQLLPEDAVDVARSVRLQRAKCQLQISELPQATANLTELLDELRDDPTVSRELFEDTRSTLANAQYYMTWLMRLEGEGRESWEPRIEAARQLYKDLVQSAEARGDDAAAERAREDLESTVRLARMELKDLQGLPLPSQ